MPADMIGSYSVLIGESNVAIDPAIGGYGVADIYLGEFSPALLPRAGLVHCPAKAFSVSRVVSLVVGETRDEETLFGLT